MALKEDITGILKLAFEKIQYAYDNHKEGLNGKKIFVSQEILSRLIFPSYSDGNENAGNTDEHEIVAPKTRISEQELRFSFVDAFNEYCNKYNCKYLYSIETPTKAKYKDFSKSKGNPTPIPHKDNVNGRSGEFDMVVYDEKLQRICLIEFKANNASPLDHRKDFVKLAEKEEGGKDVLRYFVEVLASYTNRTLQNIKNEKLKFKDNNTIFVCYSLEQHEDISNKLN